MLFSLRLKLRRLSAASVTDLITDAPNRFRNTSNRRTVADSHQSQVKAADNSMHFNIYHVLYIADSVCKVFVVLSLSLGRCDWIPVDLSSLIASTSFPVAVCS